MFSRRTAECYFYAFDLLWSDGQDRRDEPLIDRKSELRSLIPTAASRLLYVDHLEECGVDFFRNACAMDLEGIVAKRKNSKYRATEKPSPEWIKIKNPCYTQAEGRADLFDALAGRA